MPISDPGNHQIDPPVREMGRHGSDPQQTGLMDQDRRQRDQCAEGKCLAHICGLPDSAVYCSLAAVAGRRH